MAFAEYIWIDGEAPVGRLRSKMRVLDIPPGTKDPSDFPVVSFDGSSTGQALIDDSDCRLVPVAVVADPFRSSGHYLVMCEVENASRTAHSTNARAGLRAVLGGEAESEGCELAFEQEYTLFQDGRPLGFPCIGAPDPDGGYYCGVGTERAFGRRIADEHADRCVAAGLAFRGLNAERMPGQWEFQIGCGEPAEDGDGALVTCDHLWLARWILERVAENHGIGVSFASRPMKGNWAGSGLHASFSNRSMRDPSTGPRALAEAVERLGRHHAEHLGSYGRTPEARLTGKHNTSHVDAFRAGEGDRSASVRIPLEVASRGHGSIEDRRPGADADPYRVAACLARAVCGIAARPVPELVA